MGKYLLPGIVGGVGLVLAVLAVIAGWVIVPNIIEDRINEEVSLVKGSETWDKWLANPVPVYLDFYIFNVTNPSEVELGMKPILEEHGPYCYREERQKFDIKIDEEADTVDYRQRIFYFFDEERSFEKSGKNLAVNDTYNILNGPFLIMANAIWVAQGLEGAVTVNFLVQNGERIVRRNVKVEDMLFKGWPLHTFYRTIFQIQGVEPPPEFADCLNCEFRFGFYKNKNGSNDGIYKVNRGVKDSKLFGKILAWNGQTKLNWWYPPTAIEPVKPEFTYCNQINGTDGSIFQPFLEKDTQLFTFTSDACRSVPLVYKNDMEHMGIKGYKFGFPDWFMQSGRVNPNNYCWCPTPPGELASECHGGVSRIFPCKGDSPIATSSPHFLGANRSYVDYVVGLEPVENLHETEINLEPNSGLMLKISKKLQVNVEVQAFPSFKAFENLTNFMFPVFWADENVEQDEYYTDDLKSKLMTPMKIADIAKWTILGVGAALIVVGGVILVIRR